MTVQDIIATIDQDRFAAIAAKHRSDEWAKYLDLPRWIEVNLQRARRLGLDRCSPRRVLDLGAGCGYFLYVCRLFGHDVVGMDIEHAMYREITELLGVPVVEHRIEPLRPLPDIGPLDVVTAHMICFNGHCVRPWGVAEWACFLDSIDAARTVYLELNREHDGVMYPPGVRELFLDRGAEVTAHRVLIERNIRQAAR